MPSADQVMWLRGYAEVLETFNAPGLLQASYNGAKESVFTNVLIVLDGDAHTKRRRAEMAVFRRENVFAFEASLIPETMASLLQRVSESGQADLVHVAKLSTTHMAARIVGLDDCDSIERLEALAALMVKMHEGIIIDWSLRPREQVLAEVRATIEQYRVQFFEPSFRNSARAPQSRALIDILLRHREQHALDDETFLRETIHYLVASAHTSATALVHAAHDLWTWLADHPEDLARTQDADFLQGCVHESLRLNPPSGRQMRYAPQDMVLKSGRAVPAGTTIGLDLIQANRDPALFGPTADQYDPHRQKPAGMALYGHAFGGGVHVCPGRRMAAGAGTAASGIGIVVAMMQGLMKAGCRPHPTQPPREQTGTERRQYRAYPMLLSQNAATLRPLEAVR